MMETVDIDNKNINKKIIDDYYLIIDNYNL